MQTDDSSGGNKFDDTCNLENQLSKSPIHIYNGNFSTQIWVSNKV